MTIPTRIELDGAWRLAGRRELANRPPCDAFDEAAFRFDDAVVPNNIEAELERHGLLPDLFFGRNAELLKPYEFFEFLYEREFDFAGDGQNAELVFEGADCICSIFLNSKKLGKTENALVIHRLPCGEALRQGRNRLSVHIASAANHVQRLPMPVYATTPFNYTNEAVLLRKPAHAFGWDISPRMCLGGLWRSVRLEVPAEEEIEDIFLDTSSIAADGSAAALHCYVKIRSQRLAEEGKLYLRLRGVCGVHVWESRLALWGATGRYPITVSNPKLWNPRHYGNPNLYDVTAELVTADNEVLAVKNIKIGIRTIALRRTETPTDSPEPDFQFIVNGRPVRLWGTNHVPADALHARDTQHYDTIFENLIALDCNMVRMWGGGVYESDDFFNRCDTAGILVWQDFMLACGLYPENDEAFRRQMAAEARSVVRRLRQHPSLALWCGDNECDLVACWMGMGHIDPNANRITRGVLPEACREGDPRRPYLPSSPYIAPAAFRISRRKGRDRMSCAPEQHLWFQMERPDSANYLRPKVSFLSEIGRIGCPAVSTLQRFLPEEALWPADNDLWRFHASMPFLADANTFEERYNALFHGVREFFGRDMDNLADFVCASQLYQAEAMKFLFEYNRLRRKCAGLLWWNLKDAAPLLSDAAVDYYGRRKLLWHYLRQLQAGTVGFVTRQENDAQLQFINDTADDAHGQFTLLDGESGMTLASGTFQAADGGEWLERIPLPACRLLLLRWRLDDDTQGFNHLLSLDSEGHTDLDYCRRHLIPIYIRDINELIG